MSQKLVPVKKLSEVDLLNLGFCSRLNLVTFTGSLSNKRPEIRKTILALGLKKRHGQRVHRNTYFINAMIDKVSHLVTVEPVKIYQMPERKFRNLYPGPDNRILTSKGVLIFSDITDEYKKYVRPQAPVWNGNLTKLSELSKPATDTIEKMKKENESII